MYFLTKLFNKTKSKMENKIKLVHALLALNGYYFYEEGKDKDPKRSKRLAEVAAGIDKLTDELVKEAGIVIEPTKAEPKEQNKSVQQPVQKPVQQPAKTPEAKKEQKSEPEKKIEESAEKVPEGLVEVSPFYACKILSKGAKYPKPVNGNAPRTFKAFKTEELAKQYNNTYPDVDTLDMVLDEGWNMLCAGKSNKVVADMCRKELGSYYPELKSDSDWYGKLVNPMANFIIFAKRAFGYKTDDPTVEITRPTEPDLVLKAEEDLYIRVPKKVEPEKKEETTKAPEKPAEKKELKTVQEVKTPEKKVDTRVDEEAQDEKTEDLEELDLEYVEEKTEERDTNEPPKVNTYDEFNPFENLILGKMVAGAKLAGQAKDDSTRKAIQAENREEMCRLIAANFEGEEWTESIEEGKWNPKLILYKNDLVKEISANRAKWPK